MKIGEGVSGAFSKVEDGFKDAFTSIFDVLLGAFENLIFYLSKVIPGMDNVSTVYGVKTDKAYSEEQRYIRRYAEKTGTSEETLQKIAKEEVAVSSKDSASLQEFSRKIRDMKSKGEEEQIVYLKQLVEEVKKGNTKESPAPSVTVDNKGHQVVKEGK